jgi:hypothetical protein
MNYLPYFIARHAAIALDREGKSPGPFLLLLNGIGALAVAGLLAIIAFVAAWTGLALAGIVT